MSATRKISIGGVKKSRNEGRKVVTANRLADGVVIYLTRQRLWSDQLKDAAIFEGDQALDALEQSGAQEGHAVSVYLMDVEHHEQQIVPSGRGILREQIRRQGPTVRADYSVQTGGAT